MEALAAHVLERVSGRKPMAATVSGRWPGTMGLSTRLTTGELVIVETHDYLAEPFAVTVYDPSAGRVTYSGRGDAPWFISLIDQFVAQSN